MIIVRAESNDELALWRTLFGLTEKSEHWTLIGARMVELHAAAAGRALNRYSLDGDVLADAQTRPSAVRRVAQVLLADEFKLEAPNSFGVGHTFVKGRVEIDVLAPEHLGRKSTEHRATAPGARTVEVPGGRQALTRTEVVRVRAQGIEGSVPRPNLLGAILIKARAVDVDDAPDNQRSDLALLLALVVEPAELIAQLQGRERSWLSRRREMDDPSAHAWRGMAREDSQRGLAALRQLANW